MNYLLPVALQTSQYDKGFEGRADDKGHRNSFEGWRARGLPGFSHKRFNPKGLPNSPLTRLCLVKSTNFLEFL